MGKTEEDVLTIDEAADLLKMHRDTVQKHAEAGQIPGRKIGVNWRFSKRALLRYIEGTPVGVAA